MIIPFHDDNPLQRFPVVTTAIIIINVAVFAYMLTLDNLRQSVFVVEHGFVPARLGQLIHPNLVIPVQVGQRQVQFPLGGRMVVGVQPQVVQLPPNRPAVVASLFSSLFLHGSLSHLAGNMWFFWLFGNNIEDRLGRFRFVLFYIFGGVLASLCHWLMSPGNAGFVPVIGASGAVAVTLGAYAVMYPHARVRSLVFLVIFFTVIELPALIVLGFWFVGQLISAFGMSGGVAWWAHVGGFLAGALLMPFLAGPSEEELRLSPPADQDRSRDAEWW